jgi:hypothetical protein
MARVATDWRCARLAALVPKPRVHLTRYHGVLAPHSALRAAVTPAGRGGEDHSRKQQLGRTASGHELGAAAQEGIPHRHRAV